MKDSSRVKKSLLCITVLLTVNQIISGQTAGVKKASWYRGNTHTHAKYSDDNDKNDVPQIASWYKKAGYNFLVLSEHNDHLSDKKVFCHDEASDPPDFLMICGLELSRKRHHTAIGIDRFIDKEKSLQDGVNKVIEAGGVPVLNHPMDPVITTKAFLQVKGLNHLEIVNGGRLEDTPSSEILWDSILSVPNGRRVFALASDDNHYKEGNVGKGWIMVNAPALTKKDIVESIRKGNFYATTGVILKDLSFTGNSIKVTSSSSSDIITFIGKYGKILKTINGPTGQYTIKADELYVRAKITNSQGKSAWTQPVFTKTK
jgi:hypothetical protein